jgi:hypothetical protein
MVLSPHISCSATEDGRVVGRLHVTTTTASGIIVNKRRCMDAWFDLTVNCVTKGAAFLADLIQLSECLGIDLQQRLLSV